MLKQTAVAPSPRSTEHCAREDAIGCFDLTTCLRKKLTAAAFASKVSVMSAANVCRT
jgi:hypothetical protein